MTRYCLKRILLAMPVLLGISLVAFLLGVMSPGDPAEIILSQNGNDAPTESQIVEMQKKLGVNRPLPIIYLSWLYKVLHGNLGTSYVTGLDIGREFMSRLPLTIELAFIALMIAGIGGIFLGSISANCKDSKLDKIVTASTNVFLAIPSFWLALIMILLFSEVMRVLPTSGSDGIEHFIMPAFVLSFGTMATVCRYMRGALIAEFGKQYFWVAGVRGLSRKTLILKYAIGNALLPVVAILGNYFAGVLGGSIIVESIFALPGISSMALEAIRFRDYPVLQAYVLITGWIMVGVTLVVDVLMAFINPKVKLGGTR